MPAVDLLVDFFLNDISRESFSIRNDGEWSITKEKNNAIADGLREGYMGELEDEDLNLACLMLVSAGNTYVRDKYQIFMEKVFKIFFIKAGYNSNKVDKAIAGASEEIKDGRVVDSDEDIPFLESDKNFYSIMQILEPFEQLMAKACVQDREKISLTKLYMKMISKSDLSASKEFGRMLGGVIGPSGSDKLIEILVKI